MKNSKLIVQKAMVFLLLTMALISPNSLSAQFGTIKDSDNYPGRNAPKDEMHDFLQKKIRQSIELADFTALVYVSGPTHTAYDCFYGNDGKTIYTAVKVQLKHDYMGNFVTKNKEAIVVVKGGIIGEDNQLYPFGNKHLHRVKLSTFGTYLLTASVSPEEFQNRRSKDVPVYFIEYDQIYYAEAQTSVIHTYGFSTEDEFDSFVYKALKKAKRERKKKDVGFGESSTRVLGTITSISPASIHAGVGEVLTIKGTGLPMNKSDLEVRFLDSDEPEKSPGVPNYVSVDSYYIQSVSSTAGIVTIKVIVPSYFSAMDKGCAGSGKIQVVDVSTNPKTETTSTQDVDIEYAISNTGVPNDAPGDIVHTRELLAQQYCINGFIFTLHNSIKSYPQAIPTIEKGLAAWSDILTSNAGSSSEKKYILELERDVDGNLVYVSDTSIAGRNIIFFSSPRVSPAGVILMSNSIDTKFSTGVTNPPNTIQDVFIGDQNIYISKPYAAIISGTKTYSLDWHYTEGNDLPANKVDFHATFLHELGHGIGLGHVLELLPTSKSLMNPYSPTSPTVTPASDRITLGQFSHRAIDGGVRNVTDSRNVSHDWHNKAYIFPLNKNEAQIYATPIIGTNFQPQYVNPSIGNSFNPPFNFWIDNYSVVLGLSGRICTNSFFFYGNGKLGLIIMRNMVTA